MRLADKLATLTPSNSEQYFEETNRVFIDSIAAYYNLSPASITGIYMKVLAKFGVCPVYKKIDTHEIQVVNGIWNGMCIEGNIATRRADGEPLTLEDIEICRSNRMLYKIPKNIKTTGMGSSDKKGVFFDVGDMSESEVDD